MSRPAGSIVRGFQSRAGYPSNGPTAGGGYVLRTRLKVKVPGTEGSGSVRTCRNWIGQNQGLSWQEWQGSNLRPPVLETGALPIELHSCKDLRRRRSAPLQA